MPRSTIALLVVLALAATARAGWETSLRRAVQGCDRIRVRSGGTCHRDVESEKTLVDSRDRSVIRALVVAIEIDDARSGGGCMCCGEPTFEFYRGEKLLAMVGFHHGQALRWDGGEWEGDGALTPESAERICRWLAARGVKGPLEELEEARARERAMAERIARIGRILPAAARKAFLETRSRDQGRAVLASVGDDPVERTRIWFRLFGCHEGRWSRYAPPDRVVEQLLEKAAPAALGEALESLGDDAWARNGAARFVLDGRHEDRVPAESLRKALPALAEHAFAHPHVECRRSAMAGAARIGGPEAVAALRLVLAGEIEPRELPESDRVEPGGMVVMRGQAKEVREPEDDRTVAAWLLAGLGDRESVDRITALLAKAEGKDREVLEAALARLR
jgi:hypothetical protein